MCLFISVSYGQLQTQNWRVEIKGVPKDFSNQPKSVYEDSLKVEKAIVDLLQKLHDQGFFYAEIVQREWQDRQLSVTFFTGDQFKLLYLKNGNIAPLVLSDISFKEKYYLDQYLNLRSLSELKRKLLDWYENHGFPFAEVWLDSFQFKNNALSASIFSSPGDRFFIDSVRIIGSLKISDSFLPTHLGLRIGGDYQENKIRMIDKRLRELPFVKVQKFPEIEFIADRSRLNLFLDKQDANQFDGLIGFLPNQATGKLQITGDFKLRLQNALKQGEVLSFNYRGLPQQSQELDFGFKYPYLFKSRLGIKTDILFYKQDTNYLNLNTKLAFVFNYSSNKSLGFHVENYTGNAISSFNESNNNINDIHILFYGLDFDLNSLDNLFVPKKGYNLVMSLSAGNRKIKDEQTSQFKIKADLSYYFKLSKVSAIYLHNLSSLLTGKDFYENEVFRLGGLKTLRGFDEQQFFASSFMVQTLEYRIFIEENSFLNVFYDQAIMKQISKKQTELNYPFSFGAGFTFLTKIGSLSLNYALGKQRNIPLDLQKGKIHFGIVSYF
ncbi:surface antigen (D15) [Pseudopedobacter saltans DSM 12145]|uniref:Surface antigen (D15) n=1 Tax=Pseudopedobacter saltans (strain ATCC 51119 / DSM 12145 / JCM 21818 / CCUG 39354 / LMG 10337 / NBRC 100064 / NCIMB 13643) TaxID=762903 RepID=F0S4Q2_PSESL|nr:ShlB/FhaC/HecB family hemolysin secretion/activation protein [Pseudopedobacter saltans]ADY53070.1 surface antigen (D15) [Pseudopedobacter saltans DSM 12145]